jgi:hypothetical protein
MPFNTLNSQDLQDSLVNRMLAGGFEFVSGGGYDSVAVSLKIRVPLGLLSRWGLHREINYEEFGQFVFEELTAQVIAKKYSHIITHIDGNTDLNPPDIKVGISLIVPREERNYV